MSSLSIASPSSWEDSVTILSFADTSARGRVTSVARIRPMSKEEKDRGRKINVSACGPRIEDTEEDKSTTSFSSAHDTVLSSAASAGPSENNENTSICAFKQLRWKPTRESKSPLEFGFDAVFPSEATQKDIYGNVEAAVRNTLLGIDSTIIAFGQSATGKTYTMFGPPPRKDRKKGYPSIVQEDGIFARAINDLMVEKSNDERRPSSILLSYLEIHDGKIRDLLTSEDKVLVLNDRGSGNGGVLVKGLEVVSLESLEQANGLMQEANLRRTTANLARNRFSSRSHSICTITVLVQSPDDPMEFRRGRLTLVDLPSTENIKNSGVQGVHRREALRNNQDLLTLGRVILSLSSSKKHVPFRDCKLTRLLRDSLGGTCRDMFPYDKFCSHIKSCHRKLPYNLFIVSIALP